MAYHVRTSARAERDLTFLYKQINAEESAAARKWYLGLADAISSLQQHPHRCPRTAENPNIRHLLYGRKPHVYRIIYSVVEKPKRVDVLHIRHGARRGFCQSDLT
jgi:plasmid stabilization system protein ParE